jgi:sugar lactone lactonase YvrE
VEQVLYWTDINRFLIHRYDPALRSTWTWVFAEPVVALALADQPDTLLVALASRLIWWRPSLDQSTDQGFRLSDFPHARFNDGRADPGGNFWVGSMRNNLLPNGELNEEVEGNPEAERVGRLFRVAPDGSSTLWRQNIGTANTVCWSPDGRKFYFGDTVDNRISIFDYDSRSADISNERSFFADFPRGRPDGSAVDCEGYLWNCRFGGGCIVRVAPDGSVDRVIDMPALNVTTCTFGGPDRRTLFITTASMLGRPGERLAGSLFSLAVDVPGQPENVCRGKPPAWS